MQRVCKHTSRTYERYKYQLQLIEIESSILIQFFLDMFWERRRQPKDFFSWKNKAPNAFFIFQFLNFSDVHVNSYL